MLFLILKIFFSILPFQKQLQLTLYQTIENKNKIKIIERQMKKKNWLLLFFSYLLTKSVLNISEIEHAYISFIQNKVKG